LEDASMTESESEHIAQDKAVRRRQEGAAALFEATRDLTLDETRPALPEEAPTAYLDETQAAVFDARAAARYRWISPLARGRRVLDAGCGSGLGSALLAREGAAEVIGVDRAAGVLELARSWHMPANLKLQCDELESLPFPDRSFDLVVCYDVVHRQEDVKKIVDCLLRVAAPGGAVVMSFNESWLADEARSLLRQELGHVGDFRQYDLLASAIVDDETADLADSAPVNSMVVRKAASCEPGTETDLMVVGTDSADGMPAMAAVLSDPQDVRRWVAQAEAQERTIRELRAVVKQLEARLTERDQLRTELRKAEQMLAMRVSRYQEGVEAASLRTALDYQQTLSWRVTEPLRTSGGRVKRILRRRLRALRTT
jgi:SAM-dependent methyltransferase